MRDRNYNRTAFQKLCLLGSAAVYFLIFVGGLVRVSGAGLGCPDWPKCFGRWIPPFNISQLPERFDPLQFNFALAWIEYINRLLGMSIGIIIVAIILLASKKYRQHPKIIIPAISAGLLTGFQGWQGSQVVASELEPITISIHMGLAFIIAALLVYVTIHSFLIEKTSERSDSGHPAKTKIWIFGLLIVAMVQVISGTMVRGAFEHMTGQFPLLNHMEWLTKVGSSAHFHSALGLLTLLLSVYVAILILNEKKEISPLVWQSAWSLIVITIIQVVLGAVLLISNLWQVLQVMHMWLSSLMIGLLIILLVLVRRQSEKTV